ncbi:MAG: hypothetical protein U0840_05700 [Gemmataceae bacterium]
MAITYPQHPSPLPTRDHDLERFPLTPARRREMSRTLPEARWMTTEKALILASWILGGLLVVGLGYFIVTALLGQRESVDMVTLMVKRLAVFGVIVAPVLFLRNNGLR